MYAAKIIEKAVVRELIHNPLHPYTRALLAAIPDPDAENAKTLKAVPPGEPPSLVNFANNSQRFLLVVFGSTMPQKKSLTSFTAMVRLRISSNSASNKSSPGFSV